MPNGHALIHSIAIERCGILKSHGLQNALLEQIIPRATQSPAETRQYRDGREFRPALDFLEISPAHVGFLGERLLC